MGHEEISAEQFSRSEGVEEWRVLGWHAYAVYRTGDFVTGLDLVNEIGRLAEAADHHPDLKLSYPQVAVRLSTHDTNSLTTLDLDLARAIAAAARDRDLAGDPDEITAWK